MNCGEFLTRASVWLALCAYAAGSATLLLARGRRTWRARARLAWTFGCIFLLAHMCCAFSYYHGWSHVVAYRETARQTREMTGLDWGGGLFINYLFAAAWLADVLWWWRWPESHAHRSRMLTASWHGFFFFMVFNGAAVFGTGPVRWLGVFICCGLVGLWWYLRHQGIATRRSG